MACFLVPMTEAIIVSIAKKIVEKKEQDLLSLESTTEEIRSSSHTKTNDNLQTGLNWSQKLGWLNNLLWGGVFLLAIEHLWHGEIVLCPPFLTAMTNSNDILPMLHEMALVGTSMAVFITIVWGIMVLVIEHKRKHFSAKV